MNVTFDTPFVRRSNPQKETKAYPDNALSEFRRWFREDYLATKFPKYILTKANILPGGKQEAAQIAQMYQPKKIAAPKKK